MTREEAKENLYYGIQFDTLKIDKFIDKIYDSFENRSCKNCKYATLDSARYLTIHKCLMGCNKVNYDFSCSEWESK